MTTDFGVLTDFNYNDEGFQAELQAEIVDQIAFISSGVLRETTIEDNAQGDYAVITQYPTVADTPQRIYTGGTLNVNDFNDYKQRAPWLLRGDAWGIDNIVNIIAKKDPIGELMRQLSNTVSKAVQASALSSIVGAMASALASSHSTGMDFAGASITYPAVLQAKQKLGDAQMKLVAGIANSKVVNDAVQLNIAEFVSGSVGNDSARSGSLATLAGMNMSMDDALTISTDYYNTYLCGLGAVGYKFGNWVRRKSDGSGQIVNTNNKVDVEFARDPYTGGGIDILIFRMKYLVFLFGLQYDDTGGANPTDTVLATGSSWTKVADDNRKIKLVQLRTA